MLKQRIITAVILAAVFLSLIIFASNDVFHYAILGVVAIAGWEWVRLSITKPTLAHYAVFIIPLMLICYLVQWPFDVFAMTFGCVWLILIAGVLAYPKSAQAWNTPVTLYILGWLVLSLVFWAVIKTKVDLGAMHLISIILLTAAADIGAYAFGKKWGKHKLAPKVSPGKTLQGYLGGFLAVTAVAFVIWGNRFGFDSTVRFIVFLVCSSAIFHMLSVFGDLVESMFKRTRGLKDSSNILPGHGGVLDRIDALLVVIPFAYIFVFMATDILNSASGV